MKKVLTLLLVITLLASFTIALVSCGDEPDNPKTYSTEISIKDISDAKVDYTKKSINFTVDNTLTEFDTTLLKLNYEFLVATLFTDNTYQTKATKALPVKRGAQNKFYVNIKSSSSVYDYDENWVININRIESTQTITSIEVSDLQNEYLQFDEFVEGTLLVKYENNSTDTFPITEKMVTNLDLSKVGQQTATITFKDVTCTYDFNISKLNVSSIAIDTLQKDYIQSTAFVEGKLEVTYVNNKVRTITLTKSMITGLDLDKVGVQDATITYDGKTCSFTFEVHEPKITAIEVTAFPTYFIHDEFKGGTLLVSLENNKNFTTDITSSMVTNFSTSTLGEHTITITYEKKELTYKYTVLDYITLVANADFKNTYTTNDTNLVGSFKIDFQNSPDILSVDISKLTVSPAVDFKQIGYQNVTVSYKHGSIVVAILVNNANEHQYDEFTPNNIATYDKVMNSIVTVATYNDVQKYPQFKSQIIKMCKDNIQADTEYIEKINEAVASLNKIGFTEEKFTYLTNECIQDIFEIKYNIANRLGELSDLFNYLTKDQILSYVNTIKKVLNTFTAEELYALLNIYADFNFDVIIPDFLLDATADTAYDDVNTFINNINTVTIPNDISKIADKNKMIYSIQVVKDLLNKLLVDTEAFASNSKPVFDLINNILTNGINKKTNKAVNEVINQLGKTNTYNTLATISDYTNSLYEVFQGQTEYVKIVYRTILVFAGVDLPYPIETYIDMLPSIMYTLNHIFDRTQTEVNTLIDSYQSWVNASSEEVIHKAKFIVNAVTILSNSLLNDGIVNYGLDNIALILKTWVMSFTNLSSNSILTFINKWNNFKLKEINFEIATTISTELDSIIAVSSDEAGEAYEITEFTAIANNGLGSFLVPLGTNVSELPTLFADYQILGYVEGGYMDVGITPSNIVFPTDITNVGKYHITFDIETGNQFVKAGTYSLQMIVYDPSVTYKFNIKKLDWNLNYNSYALQNFIFKKTAQGYEIVSNNKINLNDIEINGSIYIPEFDTFIALNKESSNTLETKFLLSASTPGKYYDGYVYVTLPLIGNIYLEKVEYNIVETPSEYFVSVEEIFHNVKYTKEELSKFGKTENDQNIIKEKIDQINSDRYEIDIFKLENGTYVEVSNWENKISATDIITSGNKIGNITIDGDILDKYSYTYDFKGTSITFDVLVQEHNLTDSFKTSFITVSKLKNMNYVKLNSINNNLAQIYVTFPWTNNYIPFEGLEDIKYTLTQMGVNYMYLSEIDTSIKGLQTETILINSGDYIETKNIKVYVYDDESIVTSINASNAFYIDYDLPRDEELTRITNEIYNYLIHNINKITVEFNKYSSDILIKNIRKMIIIKFNMQKHGFKASLYNCAGVFLKDYEISTSKATDLTKFDVQISGNSTTASTIINEYIVNNLTFANITYKGDYSNSGIYHIENIDKSNYTKIYNNYIFEFQGKQISANDMMTKTFEQNGIPKEQIIFIIRDQQGNEVYYQNISINQ